MFVDLIVSTDAQCNATEICTLLNRLQSLVVVGFRAISPPVIETAEDDAIVTAEDVHAALLRSGALESRELGRRVLIFITGQRVGLGAPQEYINHLSEIGILSTHWMRGVDTDEGAYGVASYVLHMAMSRLAPPPCDRRSCIGGAYSTFTYLCNECETKLRERGHRDGIATLKSAINVFNVFRDAGVIAAVTHEGPRHRDNSLPLVQYYANKYSSAGDGLPFTGKAVLMVLHFLSDLIPFVRAVMTLGAQAGDIYLVAKPYPYPERDRIAHALRLAGATLEQVPLKGEVDTTVRELLRNIVSSGRLAGRQFVVIEDGGYFAPLLHGTEFSHLLGSCVGVVEQTTKGMRRDEGISSLAVPILAVAKSKFKDSYESPEIGRVTVQNIRAFMPDRKFSGGHALVLGFGSIGRAVAEQLNAALNMSVSILDRKGHLNLVAAGHRKDVVSEADWRLPRLRFWDRFSLVVGTTGSPEPSINRKLLSRVKSSCVLVSTSSDRNEIDFAALRNMSIGEPHVEAEGREVYTINDGSGRRVTVLAEGYPINFYGSDSVPNDTIDPVMAILLLSAISLCKDAHAMASGGERKYRAGVDSGAVDTIVDEEDLVSEFLQQGYRA
jgi:S-adenosylhomocysteine hydrolase